MSCILILTASLLVGIQLLTVIIYTNGCWSLKDSPSNSLIRKGSYYLILTLAISLVGLMVAVFATACNL